jgi:hypothetical protein
MAVGFKLINATEFTLKSSVFAGGPWIHMATVMRRSREYCCIRHGVTGKVFLEIVNPQEPGLFQRITDDAEWADLYRFLDTYGIFKADKAITKLAL